MNKPIRTVKAAGMEVSVWDNDGKSKSFTLRKSYKDKEEWKEQKMTLFAQDVLFLRAILDAVQKDLVKESV